MKFSTLANYFEELEATSSRLKMNEILAQLFIKADKQDIDKIIYLCQERLAPAFVKLEFGVLDKLTAKALVKTSGLSDEKIHSLYAKLGDYGLVAEEIIDWKSKNLNVADVFESFLEIATTSGEGSVEKKLVLMSKLFRSLGPKEVKFAVRIPLGSLRLGIGDPTVLDSLSVAYAGDKSLRKILEQAYNRCSDLGLVAHTLFTKGKPGIEKFHVKVGNPIRMALAERLSSAQEIIEKIGHCSVEMKFDGFRVQIHKDGDKVKMYSRNLEETTGMFPDIAEGIAKQLKAHSAILEGEALSYNPDSGEYLPFQVTVQRKRKHGIEDMAKRFPLSLFAFDLLFVDGEDYTSKPLRERRNKLKSIIKPGDTIKLSESHDVKTADELNKLFEESVTEGLEGIMAKRWDSEYRAGGRNFNWIKMKRSYKSALSDTVDLVLVGYLLGRGARTEFGIGSLLGAVYDAKEDRFKTIAKIGTGLTEEEWVAMRKQLDKFKLPHKAKNLDSEIEMDVWVEPKFVVEVLADEITRSPIHTCGNKDGIGYALRFPRVVHIRHDKTAADATTVKEIIKMFDQQRKKS